MSFNWKKDGRPGVGITAQNLEKVFPELVSTNKSTGLKSIQLANLVAPLIEAVKELSKIIERQQEKSDFLIKEVSALKLQFGSL